MQKALRNPRNRCFMDDFKDTVNPELEGKIGYTSDGLIFFITNAMTTDGQEVAATFTWSPEQALHIANKLIEAVNAGFDGKKGQEAKEHGRLDRTADSGGSA